MAYELAAWGLRNGECDEDDAVDWVLGHPHEPALPRGSSGRLNPTKHHITKGVESAVEKYEPWMHQTATFEPEPLHQLAARIEGSGVKHERYLLGAVALCFRFQTLTPVITGPLLADAVGVADPVAGRVLKEWSDSLAYGFFTGVSYDGERGHGRVWTVNTDWVPVSKPKHRPGCNRSKARCRCPGALSQNRLSIFTAAKDRSPKVRQPEAEFRDWVVDLPLGAKLTVTDVAAKLGVTRHKARTLLDDHRDELFGGASFPGDIRTKSPAVWWRDNPQPGHSHTAIT